MPDIFISCAPENSREAKLLAGSLEQLGWSVGWKKETKSETSESAESLLSTAKAVVVLWTSYSATDRYINAEAYEGVSRNILVPALFEDVFLSPPFDAIETADLIHWKGEISHPGFEKLVEKIQILGVPKGAKKKDPSTAANNETLVVEAKEIVSPKRQEPAQARESVEPLAQSETPAYVTSKSPSAQDFPPLEKSPLEGFPRRKYLVYGGLALLVLTIIWNVWRKSPETTELASSESVPYSETSEQTSEPKKFGLAAKPIKTEAPLKKAQPIIDTTLTQGSAIEVDAEQEAILDQPKVYYPPAQKAIANNLSINEPFDTSTQATMVDSVKNDLLSEATPTETLDTLDFDQTPPLVEPGSFYTTAQIGGEPNSDFLVGEKVFIRAIVYPITNENLKLKWLSGDNRVLAEKRISTGKNTDGLKIYDWKQEFPNTPGQFKVRLYNSQNLLVAETTFNIN